MTKKLSLSERISAHQTPSLRSRSQLAAILGLRDEIQLALNDGWSRKAIWETLAAERAVNVGYHAFLAYLRRAGILGRASGADSPLSPARQQQASTARSTSFQYTARPKEQDLA